MGETKRIKREKVRLSDGREGTQTRWLNDSNEWVLTELVITRTAAGARCQEVYSHTSDYDARVWAFSDLGNVTWEIID